MNTVKRGTKKGSEMIRKAENSLGKYLFCVYASYSEAKQKAFDCCFAKYVNEDFASYPDFRNNNFRIISANTFSFSVAWDVVSMKTGEVVAIRIETKDNSYYVEL